MDLDSLVNQSNAFPDEQDLKENLNTLNKKISSLILRTEHQIFVVEVFHHNFYFKNQNLTLLIKLL